MSWTTALAPLQYTESYYIEVQVDGILHALKATRYGYARKLYDGTHAPVKWPAVPLKAVCCTFV